jgi:anaerobic glycerol-3-phosphate dehydrogenase B subunit
VSDTRDITRAYVLLDHQERDGVSGLVTITSGKWTTYRQMAEATVDLVCGKLGVQRACRTHLEALPEPGYVKRKKAGSRGTASSAGHTLPESEDRGYHQLGAPLGEVERNQAYGDLICECELATLSEVNEAIQAGAQTIDDVRRDVRLGMGPCQGGFCTYRVTGLLHANNHPPVEKTNVALHDFLQERWKGLLPILWGQQLRQERLNMLIYHSLLNVVGLPGPKASPLAPEMYAEPEDSQVAPPGAKVAVKANPEAQPVDRQGTAKTKHFAPTLDVLVIGAGLAGLTAGWQLARRGKRVRVISQGWGANHWHAGCIDVLGHQPSDGSDLPAGLSEVLERWIAENPEHPYGLAGMACIEAALVAFKELCTAAGYPLLGSLERNWSLPTAAGAARPTCLAPEMMTAGDLTRAEPALIVGFERFHDFYPQLVAENLSAQGIPARGVSLNLPALNRLRFVSGRLLANLFEEADFGDQVAEALTYEIKRQALSIEFERIGFPAMLGLNRPLEVKGKLEANLERPVFEIPGLPPSIPGMRLHNLLVNEIERHGGRVYDGMAALSADREGRRITTVWSEAAGRSKANRARVYILATGDFLGGGVATWPGGLPREGVFDLPVTAPDQGQRWFREEFLASSGHPLFRAGVRVNKSFQPVNRDGDPLYENLYATGSLLAGCDVVQERSLEGVALASGFLIGNRIDQT